MIRDASVRHPQHFVQQLRLELFVVGLGAGSDQERCQGHQKG
jgi:hypothetical protein